MGGIILGGFPFANIFGCGGLFGFDGGILKIEFDSLKLLLRTVLEQHISNQI